MGDVKELILSRGNSFGVRGSGCWGVGFELGLLKLNFLKGGYI